METEVRIIDARPDWITAFAGNGDRADALEYQVAEWLDAEAGAGDRVHALGFEGFSGQGTRHVFVGRRHDGVLCRAGGDAADTMLDLALPWVDHISRLDYCVTAQLPDPAANPADALWQQGQREDPDHARLPTVTRTEERWGGYTTYVGKRSSAIVARVYNKTEESKHRYPPRSWRWEIELKKECSEQEHARLIVEPKRSQDAAAIVAAQLRKWAIDTPWSSSTDVELWRSPPRERDIDKTAKWLEYQVRPALQRLVAARGRAEALRLLGLGTDETVTGR